MNKFWTVTDNNTSSTNSRSSRYPSEDDAIREANSRIKNKGVSEVIILEATKVVRRTAPPTEVLNIEDAPDVSRKPAPVEDDD